MVSAPRADGRIGTVARHFATAPQVNVAMHDDGTNLPSMRFVRDSRGGTGRSSCRRRPRHASLPSPEARSYGRAEPLHRRLLQLRRNLHGLRRCLPVRRRYRAADRLHPPQSRLRGGVHRNRQHPGARQQGRPSQLLEAQLTTCIAFCRACAAECEQARRDAQALQGLRRDLRGLRGGMRRHACHAMRHAGLKRHSAERARLRAASPCRGRACASARTGAGRAAADRRRPASHRSAARTGRLRSSRSSPMTVELDAPAARRPWRRP